MVAEYTFPDRNNFGEIPEWQNQLIDQCLEAIAQNPDRLRPIDELFDELDKANNCHSLYKRSHRPPRHISLRNSFLH